MKAEFYDVKNREKIEAEVISKKKTDKGRCMISAKTADGRSLPKFVSLEDYNGKFADVPEAGAPKATRKCGCCKKK